MFQLRMKLLVFRWQGLRFVIRHTHCYCPLLLLGFVAGVHKSGVCEALLKVGQLVYVFMVHLV